MNNEKFPDALGGASRGSASELLVSNRSENSPPTTPQQVRCARNQLR
jgi:hypothetical protein